MTNTVNFIDGERQGFELDQLVYAKDQPVGIICKTVADGQMVAILKLPSELFQWVAENMRLHRGQIWISQSAVAGGQKRLDIGCITPTLRVAENQDGQRVYFEAFDVAHARDIIEDHGLDGFAGQPLRLKKVTRLEDVPAEDRRQPVYSLLASGNRALVEDYSDLSCSTRYDRDDPDVTEDLDGFGPS